MIDSAMCTLAPWVRAEVHTLVLLEQLLRSMNRKFLGICHQPRVPLGNRERARNHQKMAVTGLT